MKYSICCIRQSAQYPHNRTQQIFRNVANVLFVNVKIAISIESEINIILSLVLVRNGNHKMLLVAYLRSLMKLNNYRVVFKARKTGHSKLRDSNKQIV